MFAGRHLEGMIILEIDISVDMFAGRHLGSILILEIDTSVCRWCIKHSGVLSLATWCHAYPRCNNLGMADSSCHVHACFSKTAVCNGEACILALVSNGKTSIDSVALCNGEACILALVSNGKTSID